MELRSGADFADDPRPLFEADAEVTPDEPTDVPTELDDYEDWLTNTWRHPTFDAALTTVVLVDGRVAAGCTPRRAPTGAGRTPAT
ncbi:GNAT family N-acetyltransferase OS=Streptomyces microflavus OX=1919 GN=HUT09_06010 PE=4 SV=1 [Streptomyces microflavus]